MKWAWLIQALALSGFGFFKVAKMKQATCNLKGCQMSLNLTEVRKIHAQLFRAI